MEELSVEVIESAYRHSEEMEKYYFNQKQEMKKEFLKKAKFKIGEFVWIQENDSKVRVIVDSICVQMLPFRGLTLLYTLRKVTSKGVKSNHLYNRYYPIYEEQLTK